MSSKRGPSKRWHAIKISRSTTLYRFFDDGIYTAAVDGKWVNGVFATRKAVMLALNMSDAVLERLQTAANRRAGGVGGRITEEDLKSVGRKDQGSCVPDQDG